MTISEIDKMTMTPSQRLEKSVDELEAAIIDGDNHDLMFLNAKVCLEKLSEIVFKGWTNEVDVAQAKRIFIMLGGS